jgi:hypothetical protein
MLDLYGFLRRADIVTVILTTPVMLALRRTP